MKLFLKITTSLLLAFAIPAAAGDPSPSPTPAAFDVPVPIGMPVNGIKVPHYDENGQLSLLIEADVAQKINETTVELQNLRLETLDEDGRKIFVELPAAVLDLDSRILTGEKDVKIRREDFTITGDSIEFDTKNRHGTLRGNIRMLVSTENSES